MRLLQERELLKCKIDPWYFISNYCQSHDPNDQDNPYKPAPKHEYLRVLVELDKTEQFIWIEKSRQIWVTWLFCGLDLHTLLFHQGRTVLCLSKKEDDADKLLWRIKFMHDHLPEWMRDPGAEHTFCLLKMPRTGGKAEAATANPDNARQDTYSRVHNEESEFQENPDLTFGAARPTLGATGKWRDICTVNGKGFRYQFIFRKEGASNPRYDALPKIPGMVVREVDTMCAVKLHYSASPDRDQSWVARMRPTMSPDLWDQEMEMNRDKVEGRPIFYNFKRDLHSATKLPYDPNRPIIRGLDFGMVHPFCVWMQVNEYDQVLILAELMGDNVTIDKFVEQMDKVENRLFRINGRIHRDYATFGDPAGNQKNDKVEYTTIQRLATYGIICKTARYEVNVGIQLIQTLLNVRRDQRPGLLIDKDCEILIGAFEKGYVWKTEKDGDVIKEVPLKDGWWDHGVDSVRYSLQGIYDPRTCEMREIYTTRKKQKILFANRNLQDINSRLDGEGRSPVTGY